MKVEEVAAELYGLAPEDFTATRNARAKEAKESGDAALAAAIRAMRKPPVGAWLLNLLVRDRPDEVEALLELGVRLRAAQGTLGPAELKALGEERRRLTRAVAEEAAGLGRRQGRKVSAQVVADVEETLRSAMVDPGGGEALATGLLVDTFTSTGLEPVQVAQVVAVEGAVTTSSRARASVGSGPARRPAEAPQRDERAVAAARQAVEESEEAARVAGQESEEARRRAAECRRGREDLQSELAELRRRAAELEERVDAAYETEAVAKRAQISAARAERAAVESAEGARRRLQALLHGSR
jgi:hypothetical protein